MTGRPAGSAVRSISPRRDVSGLEEGHGEKVPGIKTCGTFKGRKGWFGERAVGRGRRPCVKGTEREVGQLRRVS